MEHRPTARGKGETRPHRGPDPPFSDMTDLWIGVSTSGPSFPLAGNGSALRSGGTQAAHLTLFLCVLVARVPPRLQGQRPAPGDGQRSGAGLVNGRTSRSGATAGGSRCSRTHGGGQEAERSWTTQRSGPKPLGNAPSDLTYKTLIQRQNYQAF